MTDGPMGSPTPRPNPMAPNGPSPMGGTGPTRGPGLPGGPGPIGPPTNGTAGPSPADRAHHPSDAAPVPASAPDMPRTQGRVRGRIDIADEVIEKVAAAAAYEVEGVASLGGDVDSALEWMRERIGIGRHRAERTAEQNVNAEIDGGEAEIDVVITIRYGYPLVEVARRVQRNVAEQASRMLGLRVLAVNVTIEDIEMPETALSHKLEDDADEESDSSYVIDG